MDFEIDINLKWFCGFFGGNIKTEKKLQSLLATE